ncbi:MAG: dCMP deaminase family protein [Erysipelothrix sp.]|nr:dCMP deaminase family protein [Erysipelothrix sp.]
MKRKEDVITWDEYFMGVAHLSALRSKDPSTRVGAVIVDPNKKIIGIGYNGFPIGVSDDVNPWEREGDFVNSKYAYVVHAELNAILNAPTQVRGCSLYVSLFPCNECAKAIIQSGIKEIVYEDDKYADTDAVIVSKKMLEEAGVKIRKTQHKVVLSLSHA